MQRQFCFYLFFSCISIHPLYFDQKQVFHVCLRFLTVVLSTVYFTKMSSSVVDFYRGKSVLLTGATGFIGKVLLERLLRACPEIENIYLLIRLREKKADKSVESRLRALLQSPPFTFGASPLSTDKVIAVAGDLTQPGLALSTADRQLLTEKVSVIFHSAATIKFNGPLVEFIVQNVLGTEAILQLAEDMVQLKVRLI